MSNSNMLQIIQGLSQAAANSYDGAHDERYAYDNVARKSGLKREEGCPIMDKRVNDGFSVKFSGDKLCIMYQSDVLLKDIYGGKFESNMASMLEQIKRFLQKEYKSITGNSVTLKKEGDVSIIATSVSRVRNFVQANQWYNISGMKLDGPSERTVDNSIRNFLELTSNNKRPQNDTRKKGDNQK